MYADTQREKPHQLRLVDHRPDHRRPVNEVPIPGTFGFNGVIYLRVKADRLLSYEQAKERVSAIAVRDGSRHEFQGDIKVDPVESQFQVFPFDPAQDKEF